MKTPFKLVTLCTGLLISLSAFAQVPADAPAGTTGLCKDGTYYSGATKQGACRGHKGVKDWYAAATSAAPSAVAPAAASAAAAPATPPATAPAPKPQASSTKSNFTPPAVAAPGGGPGMVWANKKSKVYHCSTDKWYGKTKDGQYLSEADAKAQGFKPDHGKACQ